MTSSNVPASIFSPGVAALYGAFLPPTTLRAVARVARATDRQHAQAATDHTHGFRIFMRETNHNPCAAGKLPIAVEFSLINPQAYFTGTPEPAVVQAIAARPEAPAYNGVVYVLSHHGNMQRSVGFVDT